MIMMPFIDPTIRAWRFAFLDAANSLRPGNHLLTLCEILNGRAIVALDAGTVPA